MLWELEHTLHIPAHLLRMVYLYKKDRALDYDTLMEPLRDCTWAPKHIKKLRKKHILTIIPIREGAHDIETKVAMKDLAEMIDCKDGKPIRMKT